MTLTVRAVAPVAPVRTATARASARHGSAARPAGAGLRGRLVVVKAEARRPSPGRRPDTELNAQSSTDLVPEAADDALPTPVEQALSAEEALAVAEAEAVAAKAAGVIEAVPAPLRTQEEIITAVLTFAVPALISTLIGPILSMIDTAFVGHVSLVQLAGMGPGTLISDITSMCLTPIGVMTILLSAKALSAGKQAEADLIMRTAMVLALGMGVAVMGWHLTCAGGLLAALQTPAVAVPSALAYVTVRAWGFPFALLNTAMWGICAGRNDPITPLLISLMSVVVNIAGDYVAVIGLGMGAAGAAWATVASQMLGTLAYPVALHFQKKRHLANLVGPLDPQFALGFLSKCLPIIFVSFATLSVYGVMTWAANLQGVITLAAMKVVSALFQFCAYCGEPVFQAVTTLHPRTAESARPLFGQVVGSMAVTMGVLTGVLSVATILFGAGIFTSDIRVHAEMAKLVVPVFLSCLLIIPSRTLQGLVVANDDLAYYAQITLLNAVAFAAVVAYIMTQTAFGFLGMWWAHVGMYAVNVVQFSLRARGAAARAKAKAA